MATRRSIGLTSLLAVLALSTTSSITEWRKSFQSVLTYATADFTQKVVVPKSPPNDLNLSSSFPHPRFLGCSDDLFCEMADVCFSNQDGILLVLNFSEESLENMTGSKQYKAFQQLYEYWDPWKPKILTIQDYYNFQTNNPHNIQHVNKALVTPCYRRTADSVNPAHFLFGQGRVFAASTAVYGRRGVPFDAIIRHQCPLIDHWPWAIAITSMMNQYAEATGTIHNQTNDIYLPYPRNAKRGGPVRLTSNDNLVCANKAYLSPDPIGFYLDKNNPEVVREWQRYFTQTFPNLFPTNHSNTLPSSCHDNLRIAIYQRSDGTALRRFVNLDQVQALAQEFTHNRTVPIVTADASTPPREQMELFNSFDILITPHGSHLINMLFTDGHAAYIEVAAVPYDYAPYDNGQAFAKEWILSYGHRPYPPNNQIPESSWDECLHNRIETYKCNHMLRAKYIQSDLMVNTTILRQNLEQAVEAVCSSS
jgi:prepilin-type processing-associated H-X9-DG protein